jgi:hypothetical protein
MTIPRKIQLAALILAIATMTSSVFPGIQPGIGTQSIYRPAGLSRKDISAPATSVASNVRRRLPLNFETNRGQADADVEFVGRGDGFGLLLKANEVVLSLQKRREAARDGISRRLSGRDKALASHRLSMTIQGATQRPYFGRTAAGGSGKLFHRQ